MKTEINKKTKNVIAASLIIVGTAICFVAKLSRLGFRLGYILGCTDASASLKMKNKKEN